MTHYSIRETNQSDSDYEALNTIWNEAFPIYPSSAQEIKDEDNKRSAKINWERYLLELEGEPVGFGVFLNSEYGFDPQKFYLTVAVKPEHHAKGYGKALYEHLMQQLKPYEPKELFSWAREDYKRHVRFLEARGFIEKLRSFQSKQDVKEFDFSSYASLEEKLNTQGIELKSAADLKDDPEFERKAYLLHTTLDLDVPSVTPYKKPSFDTFAKHHWLDERYLPEAYFIATHGEKYVAMSEHFSSKADNDLHVGLTGVLRDYRRKGIALALKLKAVSYAQKQLELKGRFAKISTWNESNNRGMLSINEALGFEKEPASLDYAKKIVSS